MQLEAAGIDQVKKVCMMKPYLIQVNSRTGKFYFKYLRFSENGRSFKFSRLAVPHPPLELANEYEEMKSQFTNKLNQKIIDEEQKIVDKNKGKVITWQQPKKINEDKLKEMIKNGMKNAEIAAVFDCSPRTVNDYRSKLRAKEALALESGRDGGVSGASELNTGGEKVAFCNAVEGDNNGNQYQSQ